MDVAQLVTPVGDVIDIDFGGEDTDIVLYAASGTLLDPAAHALPPLIATIATVFTLTRG